MKVKLAAIAADVAEDLPSLLLLGLKIGIVMSLMGSGTGAFIYQNF